MHPHPLLCTSNSFMSDCKNVKSLFELEKVNDNSYRFESTELTIPNGLIISQAMAIGTRNVSQDMALNSCQTHFCNIISKPSVFEYELKDTYTCDTSCIREVQILQNANLAMQTKLSFHQLSQESLSHQFRMPVTPTPEFCKLLSEIINQLMRNIEIKAKCLSSDQLHQFANAVLLNPINEIFDIRVVDGDSFSKMETMKGFYTKFWAKANEQIGENLDYHKLLAVYFVESTLLPTLLQYQMSRGFSPTEIKMINFSLWIHNNDINVNEWLLCENRLPIIKRGRAFVQLHLWTITGDLIATATAETIIKVMNESGTSSEPFGTDEFPMIPINYEGLKVLPSVVTLELGDTSTMRLCNSSNHSILYKIKCTSNKRISILDCAGILFPKHETVILVYRHNCDIDATDRFLIVYTIVGKQWCTDNANVLLCWQRAKAQQVPTKSIVLTAKLKQSKVS